MKSALFIELPEPQFNECPSFLEMFEKLEHLKSFETTNYSQKIKSSS